MSTQLPSSPQAKTFDAGGTTTTPISFKEDICLGRQSKKNTSTGSNDSHLLLLLRFFEVREKTEPLLSALKNGRWHQRG